MTTEEVRGYRNAEPFQPFVIVLADGSALQVMARERLGIAPWGKIGVFVGARFHLFAPTEIRELRPGFLPRR